MSMAIAILAAGNGVRMISDKPKVLHKIGGRSMLSRVLNVASNIVTDNIFVVHSENHLDALQEDCSDYNCHWVCQQEQLGTGHALKQVLPLLDNSIQNILVLYGDVPLVSADFLEDFIHSVSSENFGLISAKVNDPRGFGRIVRDEKTNTFVGIVEEKDADSHQKLINEVNSGICLLPVERLNTFLQQISCNNVSQEYYLTDVFSLAVAHNIATNVYLIDNANLILGVNNKYQLSSAERYFQYNLAKQLSYKHGIYFHDPSRIDMRDCELLCGNNVEIDINCILEGKVFLDDNVKIGANCHIKNATIGSNSVIHPNSIVKDSILKSYAQVGPFAYIRNESYLHDHAKAGFCVEVKNSEIGYKSKSSHLAYLGDSIIGKNVNIGAGAITCNYDGKNKHFTHIQDSAFIGSNVSLVAPLIFGENSIAGAGSVITKDVAKNSLVLGRSRQKIVKEFKLSDKTQKNNVAGEQEE